MLLRTSRDAAFPSIDRTALPARHEKRTGTSRSAVRCARTLVVPYRFVPLVRFSPLSLTRGTRTEQTDAAGKEDVSAKTIQIDARTGGVGDNACPNTQSRSNAKWHARRQLRHRREGDHHVRRPLWGGWCRHTT